MKLRFSLRRKKNEDAAEQADGSPQPEKLAKKKKASQSSGGISGIKQWLFLHSEKAVTVGVVGLLGFMVYNAIGKLEVQQNHTPQDLVKAVDGIRGKVTKSSFPAEEFPVPDYLQVVVQGGKVVTPPEDVRPIVPADEGPQKRRDPMIFPPRYLEAEAGNGVFFVTNQRPGLKGVVVSGGTREPHALAEPLPAELGGVGPGTNAKLEGQRWVAVCAVVPYQTQVQEYSSCFAGGLGHDPVRDRPRFAFVSMRRIEVTSGQKEDWSQAIPIDVTPAQFDTVKKNWSGYGQDPVPAAYRVAGLSQPLGPLAFDTWAHWASHSKLSGLVPPVVRAEPEGPGAGRQAPAAGRRDPRAGPQETRPVQPPPDVATELKLVRVIDFDVQPGKSYRYQFQVVATNPNGVSTGLPVFFMKNPATRDQQFVRSEWSEPSTVVVVPHDARVFASQVEMPPEGTDFPEPMAEVVVEVLEAANGAQPTGSMKLRRGEPVTGTAQIVYPGAGGKQIIVNNGANLDTDYTLLDFRPESPGGGNNSPVEMLFMDSNGNLIGSSAADDASKVDRLKKLQSALAAAPQPKGPAPEPVQKDDLNQLENDIQQRGRNR